jgi:ferritin-like metal-binding protein YciE
MRLNSMDNAFVDMLRDIYSAENQLTQALPKMAEAAHSQQLRQAFEMHLEETQEHVERLRNIFKQLGESPSGENCQAMEGLIEEGKEIIEKRGDEQVRDVALIAAAQKVEHYEIAAYGTARTLAKLMGQNEMAQLLQQTLDEEGKADQKLTDIAMGSYGHGGQGLNEKAMEQDGRQQGQGQQNKGR